MFDVYAFRQFLSFIMIVKADTINLAELLEKDAKPSLVMGYKDQ